MALHAATSPLPLPLSLLPESSICSSHCHGHLSMQASAAITGSTRAAGFACAVAAAAAWRQQRRRVLRRISVQDADSANGLASVAVQRLLLDLKGSSASSEVAKAKAAETAKLLFAPDFVYEDLTQAQLQDMSYAQNLMASIYSAPEGAGVFLESVDDGNKSSGFTWRGQEGSFSVKGTGFVRVDSLGRITFLSTLPEPLLKTGEATTAFLRVATAAMGGPPEPLPASRPRIKSPKKPGQVPANEVVRYLYEEVQNADVEGGAVAFFAPNVVYEDTVYTKPRQGKAEVEKFFNAGSIPGFAFIVDEISDGRRACGFRWHAEIAGQLGPRGLSFYQLGSDGLVTYVRDVPESTMKPPPLLQLALGLAGLAAPLDSRRAAAASTIAAMLGQPPI
eukprot:TRINITY_DN65164_c0_g1_i1.p1 TRINITY_DN65164_c0_g1~~TRINITY_DN65164_c0_g1_i1.p1  ORF type:complete len:392 (-),score=84.28 TRINITY_DN65164_c0_g1_i1:56-1231(-)